MSLGAKYPRYPANRHEIRSMTQRSRKIETGGKSQPRYDEVSAVKNESITLALSKCRAKKDSWTRTVMAPADDLAVVVRSMRHIERERG